MTGGEVLTHGVASLGCGGNGWAGKRRGLAGPGEVATRPQSVGWWTGLGGDLGPHRREPRGDDEGQCAPPGCQKGCPGEGRTTRYRCPPGGEVVVLGSFAQTSRRCPACLVTPEHLPAARKTSMLACSPRPASPQWPRQPNQVVTGLDGAVVLVGEDLELHRRPPAMLVSRHRGR